MKPLSTGLALLLLAVLPGLLRAAEPATHLDDPGRLLPADAAWARALDARLDAFEHTAGIRVLVQIHPKSPAADEDKEPGAYMRALAAKLGVIKHGVLMVYFADDPDWRVWIGDELTPVFVGRPGTAKEFTGAARCTRPRRPFSRRLSRKPMRPSRRCRKARLRSTSRCRLTRWSTV